MESTAFEKFGIDKCRNENCDQLYNEDSIKLAAWLYGVIFLHEENRIECADPISGPSEAEIMKWNEETKGYTGITCPKCNKTNFYKMKTREIKNFKKFLNSWSMSNKNNPDKDQSASWRPALIPENLRYYSPFGKRTAALNDLCVYEYAYDKPIDTLDFFDDFITTVAGEDTDSQGSFCSYSSSDKEPAGTYTGIYWFDKDSIAEITNGDNEPEKRLFPRYYYFHELMEKIDALLKYNYYSGLKIDQVLTDAEESMKTDLDNYKFHYLKKKELESRKTQVDIDHEKSGKFFGILISDPIELNPFMREPQIICDSFWVKRNPFSGKGMPKDFSFANQSDEDTELATAKKNNHKEMVDLIQENFHKQFVQEFLKDNLIDFLEEYEGLIQSNKFSYAAVWELKESYLEGLHKETNKGLREVKPYSFHFNSPGWTIRFNNQPIPGLRDIGLKYIHYLICEKNESISISNLDQVAGIDPIFIKSDWVSEDEENDNDSGSSSSSSSSSKKKIVSNKEFFELAEIMDAKGFRKIYKQKEELERAFSVAELKDDPYEIDKAQREYLEFMTHLKEYYIPGLKKKRRFIAKENKDLRRRMELAITRAIEKIKGHNNELYLHFAQSIYGLPRGFYKKAGTKYLYLENSEMMYKPYPDIDWHLD